MNTQKEINNKVKELCIGTIEKYVHEIGTLPEVGQVYAIKLLQANIELLLVSGLLMGIHHKDPRYLNPLEILKDGLESLENGPGDLLLNEAVQEARAIVDRHKQTNMIQ